MKFEKIIILSTIFATLTTSVAPVATFAAESNYNQKQVGIEQNANEKNQLDKNKYDKYVKLNATTKQFELVSSAKKNLNKEELNIVQTYINDNNKLIKEVENDKNSKISINGNSIQVKSQKASGSISIDDIDYDSYWDYSIHWWGVTIFLSNSLINDMKSVVGSDTVGFFAGGATGLAMTNLLVDCGISSGPAGWIGLACGGAAVYEYDQMLNHCDDTGVCIDITGHLNGNLMLDGAYISGIYGA